MASLTMMQCIFPVALQTNGAVSGLNNARTPDPKEIVYAASASAYAFDLGAVYTIDHVFIGYVTGEFQDTFLPNDIDFRQLSGPAVNAPIVGAPVNIPRPIAGSKRRHTHLKLAAPMTGRYFQTTMWGPPHSFGILAVGKSIQPAWGHEWGSGRQPQDMSSVTPLRGGGFGIERGARMGSWRWTCGDLTDAETKELWAMAEDVGVSSPIVVCEDPDYSDGLNARLHYGLFDRPEAYEREIPGATRWSFQMREWV